MRESTYQAQLIKKLKRMFPGCMIQKNDANYTQGFPDLTIYYGDKWAVLEVKASIDAPTQPNQPYYIDKMNGMSFGAFIYPENESEVLRDLQYAFGSTR